MRPLALVWFAALAVGNVLGPAVAGATSLTLTPNAINSDYAGTLSVQVSAISAGQAARIETFLDENRNGSIDSGEPLVLSFDATDGASPLIAGVRDINVPGDDDGTANGSILMKLSYAGLNEIHHAEAAFVYRVSSPTGQFSSATASLTVTSPPYTQHVTGQVRNGSTPVPYALVFSLDSNGLNTLALADGDAHFDLSGPAGTYQLGALRRGFVFSLTTAPTIALPSGAALSQDVSLVAADRTISGRIADTTTGNGIAGVQTFCLNNTENSDAEVLATIAFSDATGGLNIPVVASAGWSIGASPTAAMLGGYLRPPSLAPIDTSTGSVSGVLLAWEKANALVYGTVQDQHGQAVSGIALQGTNAFWQSDGLSDAAGNYSLVAPTGNWFVQPPADALSARGYVLEAARLVDVADGSAVRVDFTLRSATSHLTGRVHDYMDMPVAGLGVVACNGGDSCPFATTQADGSFDIGVEAGTWNITPDPSALTARNLVGSQLGVTVADGQDQSGLDLSVRQATGRILGSVVNAKQLPIARLNASAQIVIGGVTYSATRQTDDAGSFQLLALDGQWTISLDCQDAVRRGYVCPSSQLVTIAGNDGSVQFDVQGTGCIGDCNNTGTVSSGDLLLLLDLALRGGSTSGCAAGDADGNGQITIEDLISAVGSAQRSCGG